MRRVERLVFVLALCAIGCPKREQAAQDAGAPGAGDAMLGEAVESDDEIHPVYPVDAGPPDPLATRLCHVLHDVPEQKRAACCGAPPAIVLTSECVRVVTAALRFKAIALDPAAIDACAAALDKALEGCEWPGPFPPALPPACQGIVKGTLAERARCRSSLECAGTLRCQGVGPTATGRCAPAAAEGERCGGSADPLVTFARQNDEAHPECAGWCNRTKCAAHVPVGGACTLSAACGSGRLCALGKCAVLSPAKAGEACPGGVCEGSAVCLAGKCVARKASGAECATDFECVGGCNKTDGGAKGACGKKCSVR
jgi:hypothetical protein